MPLEEAIRLVVGVKDMPLGIEEARHVLVSHGQRRVIGLQARDNSKELLVRHSMDDGKLTRDWAHNELA